MNKEINELLFYHMLGRKEEVEEEECKNNLSLDELYEELNSIKKIK